MSTINVDQIKPALALVMLQEMATDEDVIIRYDPDSKRWTVLPPGKPGGRHTDLVEAIIDAYPGERMKP